MHALQACRLPYALMVDGVIHEMGDVQYLLSPQDLAAVELVPELIQAGIGCFKIEGGRSGACSSRLGLYFGML